MIRLTETWYLHDRSIVHACAPSIRVVWSGAGSCDCGAQVPRRVDRFRSWMMDTLVEPPVLADASVREAMKLTERVR